MVLFAHGLVTAPIVWSRSPQVFAIGSIVEVLAQADGVDLDHRQIAVAVGRAVPVKRAGPAQVICDDTTFVRIEVAEGALRTNVVSS